MLEIMHWGGGRVVPALVGAAGGLIYYRVVGCRTGACPITSNPWISSLYGALVGFLLSGA